MMITFDTWDMLSMIECNFLIESDLQMTLNYEKTKQYLAYFFKHLGTENQNSKVILPYQYSS